MAVILLWIVACLLTGVAGFVVGLWYRHTLSRSASFRTLLEIESGLHGILESQPYAIQKFRDPLKRAVNEVRRARYVIAALPWKRAS